MPPPNLEPSCSPPKNCPLGPPLRHLPLEPWCPRSKEWWQIEAMEHRRVSREAGHTLLGIGKDPLLSMGFVPTTILTTQKAVGARTYQARIWKSPRGAAIGARIAVPKLLHSPWASTPLPPSHSRTWSLEISSGIWVSNFQSCHCDSALKLMGAKQGVRVGA